MFKFKNLKKPTPRFLTVLGNSFIAMGTALTTYGISISNITIVVASIILGGLGKVLCEMYESKNTIPDNSANIKAE